MKIRKAGVVTFPGLNELHITGLSEGRRLIWLLRLQKTVFKRWLGAEVRPSELAVALAAENGPPAMSFSLCPSGLLVGKQLQSEGPK